MLLDLNYIGKLLYLNMEDLKYQSNRDELTASCHIIFTFPHKICIKIKMKSFFPTERVVVSMGYALGFCWL